MTGFDPALSYAVACCHARQEFHAEDGLRKMGLPVYLPRWRSCTGKVQPAFLGYIFVSPVNGGRPQDVFAVSRLLLASGGQPATIPGTELLWLWELEHKGMLREAERPNEHDPHGVARLPVGTPLQALSGPFVGMPCELQSTSGRERLKVLYDILGRKVSVDMRLDQVRAIG